MTIQKFSAPEPSSASGFIVTDLDGATGADGVVRCAKKVLLDGARTMARSRSYAWALLGERRSGASAGISHAGDRDAGVAAFVGAAAERTADGSLVLDPGKGTSVGDLAPLHEGDPRHPGDDAVLLAASVVAAADTCPGGLDGRTVAIEGAGVATAALIDALTRRGARVTAVAVGDRTLRLVDDSAPAVAALLGDDGAVPPSSELPDGAVAEELDATAVLSTGADVLVCGSKLGVVDHEVAATLPVGLVVPVGPAPVTAKGLAVATRRGVSVLPDFLTTAGPLQRFLVADPAGQLAAAEQAAARLAELLDHAEGPYLAACSEAEAHLSGWLDELPFGRPLA